MIDQKRLAQLLGMTGSEHSGEALNAARLANRMVKEAGLTWSQVLEGGGYNEDFVKQVARQAYESGLEDGKPKPAPLSLWARKLLASDLRYSLSAWETQFLRSYAERNQRSVSDKQAAVLENISNRLNHPLPSPDWSEVA